MRGGIEQVRVVGEHRLRAVAVMNVEIDHGDALDAPPDARVQAATAALLNRQNPIGRLGSAWCPGGRTAAKAARAQPSITASTAMQAPPAARAAASALPWLMTVSPSSCTGWPSSGWIDRIAST